MSAGNASSITAWFYCGIFREYGYERTSTKSVTSFERNIASTSSCRVGHHRTPITRSSSTRSPLEAVAGRLIWDQGYTLPIRPAVWRCYRFGCPRRWPVTTMMARPQLASVFMKACSFDHPAQLRSRQGYSGLQGGLCHLPAARHPGAGHRRRPCRLLRAARCHPEPTLHWRFGGRTAGNEPAGRLLFNSRQTLSCDPGRLGRPTLTRLPRLYAGIVSMFRGSGRRRSAHSSTASLEPGKRTHAPLPSGQSSRKITSRPVHATAHCPADGWMKCETPPT